MCTFKLSHGIFQSIYLYKPNCAAFAPISLLLFSTSETWELLGGAFFVAGEVGLEPPFCAFFFSAVS